MVWGLSAVGGFRGARLPLRKNAPPVNTLMLIRERSVRRRLASLMRLPKRTRNR